MSELTPEMIDAIVKATVAASSGGRKRKGRGFTRSTTPEEKELRKAANDKECIRVFTAAGYKDVKPRINVLTYGKVKPDGTKTGWIAQGRQVRKGEKGLAVGPFNLFHVDQTEPLTATPAASVGTVTAPAPASAVSAASKAEVKAEAPTPPSAEVAYKKAMVEAEKKATDKWTEWNS